MSTAYGYVRMQFTKKDGSADGEIAKKIYRYCTQNFDFFNTPDDDWESYGDAFKLTEEKGEIGSAYVGDGFYIEEAAAEILEDNWIQEIYKEFTPYQMKVQIHQDYSESSFDNNSINRYMVSEENGQRKLSRCRSFYFTNGAQFDTDRYNFESEDGDYYLLNDDCDKYSLMAKNKNTGRVIELNNYVVLNEEDEDLIFYGVYDSDGDSVSLFDDDSMATYEDWDSCIDVDDLLEGESEEQSDWEIYIDVPKRNVFFKEPVKQTDPNGAGSSSQPYSPKCPKCGAELPEGAAFCIKCGTKIEAPAEPVCSNCGEKLPEGAAFCIKCGTRVGQPAAPVTPPEPETPVEPVQSAAPVAPAAPEEPERVLSQLNGKTVFQADDFEESTFDFINSSWSLEGKTLTVSCDKITNESDWDTASLQMNLYLCPETNGEELVDCDGNVNGTKVATYEYNPLKKGFHFPNVKKSIKIPETIKSGKYYVVMQMFEYGASDGQVYVYPATWWDFDHKLLDYNADAFVKGDSLVYKNIYLYNEGDFPDWAKKEKAKCAFCKKQLSGYNLIGTRHLKPRLGSLKNFRFCSVDCGKKWIDAEGSKYRDLAEEKKQQLKQARERIERERQ